MRLLPNGAAPVPPRPDSLCRQTNVRDIDTLIGIVTGVKGLTERTEARWYEAREAKAFASLTDLLPRVGPSMEEADPLLRCGVFDCFGNTRTEQFWQLRHWLRCHGPQTARQGWLLPPPALELLPEVPLMAPLQCPAIESLPFAEEFREGYRR